MKGLMSFFKWKALRAPSSWMDRHLSTSYYATKRDERTRQVEHASHAAAAAAAIAVQWRHVSVKWDTQESLSLRATSERRKKRKSPLKERVNRDSEKKVEEDTMTILHKWYDVDAYGLSINDDATGWYFICSCLVHLLLLLHRHLSS